MTDEAKALVDRLRWSHWYYEDAGENTSYTSEAPLEAADLIETQAREIERLREAVAGLMKIAEMAMPDTYFATDSRVNAARAALAGDSHD